MHDPLSRVPIKYKLTGAFVGLCIVAFGFGGYLISVSAGSALESEINLRLHSQATLLASSLEHQLELLGRRAEDFASDGFIRTHADQLQSGSTAHRSELRNRLQQHLANNKLPLVPSVSDISILDTEGKTITSVHGSEYPVAVAEEGALGIDSLYISAFIVHDTPGSVSFGLFTPLWDIDRSRIIGTLVYWIDVGQWLQHARWFDSIDTEPGQNTYVTIGDSNGNILRISNGLHEGQTDTGYSRITVLSDDAPNLLRKELFTLDRKLDHCSWDISLGVEKAAAMESVSGLESMFLAAGLVIALVSVVVLFFPIRFLVNPLARMRDAAKAMMEGDYAVRVIDDTDDEIGDLARSFNSMAAATQERTRKLQETARQLEHRSTELRMERDLLNTVIHSMEDGVIYVNEHGEVALFNQNANNLANDLISNSSSLLSNSCKDEGNCGRNCRDCLTDTEFTHPSCIVECGDIVYEVLSARVRTGDRQHGRILVARDISDRVRINERQAHQDRLAVLGEVAATMAHELNNPLAAASMFAQMMKQDGAESAGYSEHLDVINRSIETCKRTISDLLRYSRSKPAEVDEIDIHELLVDVIRFLKPLYETKEVSFNLDFQTHNPITINDETYIRQVLINLLMNAL